MTPPEAPPPVVVCESVLDRRGAEIAALARAESETEEGRAVTLVVAGVDREPIVFRLVAPPRGDGSFADARPGLVTMRRGERSALRFDRAERPEDRSSAWGGESAFAFFESDLRTRTVICNLARIAEGADAGLLDASREVRGIFAGLPGGPGEEVWPALVLAPRKEAPGRWAPGSLRRAPRACGEGDRGRLDAAVP